MNYFQELRKAQEKKVAVIAIRHHEFPNLYLFGKRKDNQSFSLPGGHFEPNEEPHTAANRELKEETGLEVPLMSVMKQKYPEKNLEVYLFQGSKHLSHLTTKGDPDDEFESFIYLDPHRTDVKWHVPRKDCILLKFLGQSL